VIESFQAARPAPLLLAYAQDSPGLILCINGSEAYGMGDILGFDWLRLSLTAQLHIELKAIVPQVQVENCDSNVKLEKRKKRIDYVRLWVAPTVA